MTFETKSHPAPLQTVGEDTTAYDMAERLIPTPNHTAETSQEERQMSEDRTEISRQAMADAFYTALVQTVELPVELPNKPTQPLEGKIDLTNPTQGTFTLQDPPLTLCFCQEEMLVGEEPNMPGEKRWFFKMLPESGELEKLYANISAQYTEYGITPAQLKKRLTGLISHKYLNSILPNLNCVTSTYSNLHITPESVSFTFIFTARDSSIQARKATLTFTKQPDPAQFADIRLPPGEKRMSTAMQNRWLQTPTKYVYAPEWTITYL